MARTKLLASLVALLLSVGVTSARADDVPGIEAIPGIEAVPGIEATGTCCLARGFIRVNGALLPAGETVICHHSEGTTETLSNPGGTYACGVAPGPITLEVRRLLSPGPCPSTCDGETCGDVVCNVTISCGCCGPSATALLLPLGLLAGQRRARIAGLGRRQRGG